MDWLQGSSQRWRLVLGGLTVVLVGMLAAVVFTTYDSVVAGSGDCGSPIAPNEGAPDGCEAELGHARATRTALLAWSLPCLAGMWFVESRGRASANSAPARAPLPSSPPPLQHGPTPAIVAHRAEPSSAGSGDAGGLSNTTTYPRARRHRLMMQAMTALFATIGLVIAAAFVLGRLAGDPMPPIGVFLFMTVWTAGACASAFYEYFVQPASIVARPDALCFESRWRPAEVQWNDLIEVRSPASDPNRQAAVWRWNGGKRRTWTAYEGWHRLLSEVELRAPQASIRGF